MLLPLFSTVEKLDECLRISGVTNFRRKVITDHDKFVAQMVVFDAAVN